KLVLWCAAQAGNYVYLVEYNFTDDGRIVCRLGFTAHNFFDREKIPGPRPKGALPSKTTVKNGDTHPHVGCWQLDFDLSDIEQKLGGPAKNKIQLVSRKFVGGKFELQAAPFPGPATNGEPATEAREGKAKWVAAEFTTLRAESLVVKNSRGLPI